MAKTKLSPMMKQYVEMKEKYSDAILLYRLGDFYEMFFDDAKTASEFLGLTLTGRDCGLEEKAPMCGVPYHAVDMYIRKLIEGGYKVAICEQLSDPAECKGMVDRDVVRVITPGTVIEDNILEEKKSNYLMSVTGGEDEFGAAWSDISTGEFCCFQYKGADYLVVLRDFFVTVSPSEIIASKKISDNISESPALFLTGLPKVQNYYEWAFGRDIAYKKLLKKFNVCTLAPFECEDKPLAISAAGALIEYFEETQKRSLSHINKIKYLKDDTFMFLDANTRRNLELTETIRDKKKKGSVLWLLDKTRTSMGGRELRRWVEQPLCDSITINRRLDSVEEFISKKITFDELREVFSKLNDIERLAAKIAYGNVNPRDCISLKQTLAALPQIKKNLSAFSTKYILDINKAISPLGALHKLLESAIDDNPPALTKDGGYIKIGYDKDLEELRNAQKNGKVWLANLERAEKEDTGIKTLKVSYNRVFGYYIEVSKSLIDKVPFRYQRLQTLSTGERYYTPELKEIEKTILGAEENSLKLEQKLFENIKSKLFENISEIQKTARAIAEADALMSLAAVADEYNYVKPVINKKVNHILIKEGRHPVVERLQSDDFVPNDTLLDTDENRTMVITGPNMAGKSTYMRQVAVITLLAHIGSFVPALSAEISLTDRIFTRVGASDDLISGQSTFMMEMVEVASILNNATQNSLLILDEIGRGTSTIDGLSIAWAVMERISSNIRAKTLFATHFHELTELEGVLSGVKNFRILIKEIGGKVLFLHKIVRGGANKSFGIEVASLAGVPQDVVKRAKEIFERLTEADINRDTNSIMLSATKKTRGEQIGLFEDTSKTANDIIGILKDTDIENCTPIQAFAILMDLKEKAENE